MYKNHLKNVKLYTGEEVADYIEEITEDKTMVVYDYIRKYVKPFTWVLTPIPVEELIKDRGFKEALDYHLTEDEPLSIPFRYEYGERDFDQLFLPIVFYQDEKQSFVIDGYSRAITRICEAGEDHIEGFTVYSGT